MSASPVVESPLSAHAPRFSSDFTDNKGNVQSTSISTSMATAIVASPSPVPATSSSLSFVVPPATTSFAHTEFTPAAPPSKRPKLSLNTTSLPTTRTLGKGNTGLRLDTIATSTASPTLRNTYRNAYGSSSTARPSQTSNSDDDNDENDRPHTPIPQGTLAHSSGNSLPSSVESSPELRPVPYSRLSSLRSVLKNSPLPHPTPRGVRARLFPPHKSVQLSGVVEEITTKVYTRTHADMSSDDDDDARCVSKKRCSTSPPADQIHHLRLKVASGELDDDEDVEADDDDQPLAKTPVAGRARKRREWVWTLDSPPKVADQSAGVVEKDKSTLAEGYS